MAVPQNSKTCSHVEQCFGAPWIYGGRLFGGVPTYLNGMYVISLTFVNCVRLGVLTVRLKRGGAFIVDCCDDTSIYKKVF